MRRGLGYQTRMRQIILITAITTTLLSSSSCFLLLGKTVEPTSDPRTQQMPQNYDVSNAASPYEESQSQPQTSAPSSYSSSSSASQPAPAGPVSVRIRSQCSKSVGVFYGQKPKFGSGTKGSISGNSTESHTFRPGEMFWIIDASENGIDSATISSNTREIEIGSNCTSVSTR
jgi:hypothetical protein